MGELIDMEVEHDVSSSDGRMKERRFEEERQLKKGDRLSSHPDAANSLWRYEDMKRTTLFRRDFSTAINDYNTFYEERRHTQEAFAQPTQWPTRAISRVNVDAKSTVLRSRPVSPTCLPKVPETIPAAVHDLRQKLEETKERLVQEQPISIQPEGVPVKNVHFLDDYRLQTEWAQEEEDRLIVERIKAELLAKRELARQ